MYILRFKGHYANLVPLCKKKVHYSGKWSALDIYTSFGGPAVPETSLIYSHLILRAGEMCVVSGAGTLVRRIYADGRSVAIRRRAQGLHIVAD